MNCPRCGNAILDGTNKCNNCGLILINSNNNESSNINNQNNNSNNYVTNSDINNDNNTPTNSNNLTEQNNNSNTNNPINLEGYFTGKNYDKIKKRKWSWNTFVFGFIYTLYRKLILLSIIWIIIDAASVMIMGKYSIAVIASLNIIMSFLFNFIYFGIASTKIDSVKRKYWGHSIDEIVYRVSRRGGTSGLAIFFFGFAIVVLCIGLLILYVINYPQYYIDKLYFRVPKDFEAFGGSGEEKTSFVYSDETNYCTIVASKENDYDTVDDYINSKLGNTSVSVDKENVKIFGREWKLINIEFSDTSKSYYYVTEKNGDIYNFEFNIYNGYGQKCEDYYKYIKNSMSIR